MNVVPKKIVLSLVAVFALAGCSSAVSSKQSPSDSISRSGAGKGGTTDKSSSTNTSSNDTPETTIVADKGNYPFAINFNSRLRAAPLPFDGKDWSQPDAVTGAAIAAFSASNGVYATPCSNGVIKFFIIEDALIINQSAFFNENDCSSGFPSATLSRIIRGQDISKSGNTFNFSGVIMDVTLSPKSMSKAAEFSSVNKCGISDWVTDTIISVVGAICDGVKQPDAGTVIAAQLTTNDVSLTLGNGIIYSKQPVTLGITGGSKISVSSSMLALSTVALMNNQQSFCTGTLISDSYVVTAAHCIDAALTMPKENLFIGFGENGSKKVKVQSLIKHEEYTDQNLNKGFTPQANYDLGLVKLSGTIPKPYRPVAILPASEQFISNEKVYIAGYGLDEKGSVGTLKASFSMFAEESSAAVNFRTVSALTQSTCNGDSGGPAYVVRGDYYYLVGATSYGPSGFYCRGGDSFFVDLRKVASWIESRIN